MPGSSETPPTDLARRFVRYLVGFGVGVGLAALVFLKGGLYDLVPDSLRSISLQASTLLTGLVAVAVQFYAREWIRRRTLRRLFTLGLLVLVSGVVLFLCLHLLFVDKYKFGDEIIRAALPGWRLEGCPCPEELSTPKCAVEEGFTEFGEPITDNCWASWWIAGVEASLMLTYLLITVGFGALVGLVVIQEELRREARRRRPKKPRFRRREKAADEEAGEGGGG